MHFEVNNLLHQNHICRLYFNDQSFLVSIQLNMSTVYVLIKTRDVVVIEILVIINKLVVLILIVN